MLAEMTDFGEIMRYLEKKNNWETGRDGNKNKIFKFNTDMD